MQARPTVFLVNHIADERQLYGDALEIAGFTVVRLADPGEALLLVAERPPAAVVTRVLRLGHALDGIQLTRAIKSEPSTMSVPVIVTTSFAYDTHREAACAAGCDEYLLLPVLPDELVWS
jgi:CheY-like chemotaxis protein